MSHQFAIPPDAVARQKMLQEHFKTHSSKLIENQEGGARRNAAKSRHDEPHNGSSERHPGAA